MKIRSGPATIVMMASVLGAMNGAGQVGREPSLVTGKPLGEMAVAGRLAVDLHAAFMLSREYGTERALNWFNCGYAGGGGGGGTEVGGTFGFFGFQVVLAERALRYPLAVEVEDVPALRFDGDDFLKGNFGADEALLKSGGMAVELWFRTSGNPEGTALMGWQSLDGRERSATIGIPDAMDDSTGWRHLVVNASGGRETWWVDGRKLTEQARSLRPEPGHVMVLGGASSLAPAFRGDLAAVRVHDQAMTEDEIRHNTKGGVMLGTEMHDWWATEPDRWWIQDSRHFRHAIDQAEMAKWSERELADFYKRLPEMFELAELCYHVYSERLAMRTSAVSVKPEQRGDGIKYRTPIQATNGSWMGFDGSFGWACQGAGFINPHELVHGFQAMTGGMAGNHWETHANFPQTYLGIYQTVPVVAMEGPSVPSNGRTYYHDRGFLEHLAQTPEYGPMFISKLWYDGPTAEMKNPFPWTVFEKINPHPERTLAREYTRGVMRNVTMDFTNFREFKPGTDYRDGVEAAESLYQRLAREQAAWPQRALLRGRTVLRPLPHEPGWWRVPKSQAPQQLGYNICPLAFTPGTVVAEIEGYTNSRRGGDWHAGFVGVGTDGRPRYGEVTKAGDKIIFETGADLAELYLVVCATPKRMMDIEMTGDLRSFEQEPFPWKVRLAGCEPREPLLEKDPPGEGASHPNGGGSVAAGSSVAATAWVGPDARVMGNSRVEGRARIEDHAVVLDSVVRDDAVISGHALVMGGSTVSGKARVRDHAVIKDETTVTDDARVLEHAVVATRKTAGGHVTIKGVSSVYGGNQRGTAIIDGWYAKGNDINKGKWFTWSWGAGKNPGEEDVDYAGLYADYSFNASHDWMARDDHGLTWGYIHGKPRWVKRVDELAAGDGDQAMVFDGKSVFIELPGDVADFSGASYTIQFRLDASPQRWAILSFPGDGEDGMTLKQRDDGKMEFSITAAGRTESLVADAPPPGKWIEVRVIWDAPLALLQIDGVTVARSTNMTLSPRDVGAEHGFVGRGAGDRWFSGEIGRFTVHSIPLVDETPPAPDPAAFELAPCFVSPATLLMIAKEGADPLGGVEYCFEEEGRRWSSGWVSERVMKLENRELSRPLLYRVRMRDRNGNMTAWSQAVRAAGHPVGAEVHRVGGNRMAVIEAEEPLRVVASADGTSVWQEESHEPGYVGRGFMAVPDQGRVNDPFRADGARLDYALRFEQAGTYYLWVRASGNNDGGQHLHAGLGLDPGNWGVRMRTGFGGFKWTRFPAFKIGATGDHLLSLWMAEDGAAIDRMIVTGDEAFTPSPESRQADGSLTGTGPFVR